jgi:hypothetical protein
MDYPAEWQALTGIALEHVRELCDLTTGIRQLEELFDNVALHGPSPPLQ